MNGTKGKAGALGTTLEVATPGSLLAQAGLVAAAVGLPVAAHLGGAPVRMLLPMHWPVILAGLVFGWRGGLAVGALAPTASFLISGYPLPPVLVQMSLELATYGAVAGWLRERARTSGFLAVATALVAGRIVFIASTLVLSGATTATFGYLRAALLPGVVAAVVQTGTLPLLADRWTSSGQGRGSRPAGTGE